MVTWSRSARDARIRASITGALKRASRLMRRCLRIFTGARRRADAPGRLDEFTRAVVPVRRFGDRHSGLGASHSTPAKRTIHVAVADVFSAYAGAHHVAATSGTPAAIACAMSAD